jgi:hypothetical protein
MIDNPEVIERIQQLLPPGKCRSTVSSGKRAV